MRLSGITRAAGGGPASSRARRLASVPALNFVAFFLDLRIPIKSSRVSLRYYIVPFKGLASHFAVFQNDNSQEKIKILDNCYIASRVPQAVGVNSPKVWAKAQCLRHFSCFEYD